MTTSADRPTLTTRQGHESVRHLRGEESGGDGVAENVPGAELDGEIFGEVLLKGMMSVFCGL